MIRANKTRWMMYHTPKVLASIVCAVALLTACTTKNTSQSGYYGVPAMYRTIPERISDEAIERTSYKNLPNISGVSDHNVRIAVDSFRREVILTGEVPSEQIRQDVANMIASINDVKKVHDHLIISATPKAQSHTLHENYLKSKIIAKIVSAGSIKSSQYKLVVRNNMAYLLGFLTAEQEQIILNAIQSTQGMEGIKIFGTRATFAQLGNQPALDNQANTGGVVYGGNSSLIPATPVGGGSSYPSTTNTYPQSSYQGNYPNATNPNAPIIKMEGSPTSSYVDLYNNTDKP